MRSLQVKGHDLAFIGLLGAKLSFTGLDQVLEDGVYDSLERSREGRLLSGSQAIDHIGQRSATAELPGLEQQEVHAITLPR